MCTAMTGGALGYGYSQVKKTKEEEELVAKKEAPQTEQKKTLRAPTA